jgi:hypothetical protein
MNELDFRPKTRSVRLGRSGWVSRHGELRAPCTVVEVREPPITKTCTIDARFVWQRDTEPAWRLGTLHPEALLERAI